MLSASRAWPRYVPGRFNAVPNTPTTDVSKSDTPDSIPRPAHLHATRNGHAPPGSDGGFARYGARILRQNRRIGSAEVDDDLAVLDGGGEGGEAGAVGRMGGVGARRAPHL